ncbi:HAMP domain-containing sensor histidine kinase [Clostridium sp. E02]|uniref:sensor histidine kinase n=1 Tax=Clostridium sp. E02 TaxID=2487134 RepID=UPI000F52810B|nr:HAMP domain-containing sensor histidine kinase [Clostridium sp. E02]
MRIFTTAETKGFFIGEFLILCCFTILIQLISWRLFGKLIILFLILSLLLAVGILGSSLLYLWKQSKRIEQAALQVNSFLSGNTHINIDCNHEGELYKLFHAVNTLASVLNAQAEKEQERKEFLKAIISDISHQLKTPLAALNIYNGLLQDESMDMATIQEFVSLSEQELDRIDVLVQNLLKLSRLDAGTIVVEKKEENIAEMMNGIKSRFEFQASEEQKIISLQGSKTSSLFCDKNWVAEAVGNLIKNALDHTGAGCLIELEWKELPSMIQIKAWDNGSGIHQEDIYHIFKRFYRSRFSRDVQGLGLGLPLAKAIIEAHNGTISVNSVLGEGSTFTICIPNITKM